MRWPNELDLGKLVGGILLIVLTCYGHFTWTQCIVIALCSGVTTLKMKLR